MPAPCVCPVQALLRAVLFCFPQPLLSTPLPWIPGALGVIHGVNVGTLSRLNTTTEDNEYCFSPLCFPHQHKKIFCLRL